MLSSAAICTLALTRIGIGQPISNLTTDESQEAKVCRAVYEFVRDLVLEAFPWPFATKYGELNWVADDPNGDWAYSYRTPPDCLRVRRIVSGFGLPVDQGNPIRFALGSDASGGLIYTDQQDAFLEYTSRITTEVLFPPSFDSAFAWRIAVEIAMPLAVREALAENARQKFMEAMIDARANQLNQQDLGPLPESEFVRARY